MEQTDPTESFFAELGRRGHEPLLARTDGLLRFELVDGDQTKHWNVQVDHGQVSVSRGVRKGGCTVRSDKALFDRILTGQANAMASFLRGEMDVIGDSELLVVFPRLFRGPRQVVARRDDRREDSRQ